MSLKIMVSVIPDISVDILICVHKVIILSSFVVCTIEVLILTIFFLRVNDVAENRYHLNQKVMYSQHIYLQYLKHVEQHCFRQHIIATYHVEYIQYLMATRKFKVA